MEVNNVKLTMKVSIEMIHKYPAENDFDRGIRDLYEAALAEAAHEWFESNQDEIFDSIHAMVDLKVSGNVN